jgi:hypothetical protein
MYPAPARPGLGWKFLQSWWVLISLFGFGCFSGAGLVLVGLRARKPAWWGFGLGYLLISTGTIVAYEQVETPEDESSGGGFAALWLVLWFVCIVHSFVLNVYWLRWLEQRWAAQHGPAAGFGGSPAGFGSPAAFGSPVAGFGSPAAYGSPVGPATPYSAVPFAGSPTTASSGFPAQQHAAPQYDAQQYGAQQYGAPQYGAAQQYTVDPVPPTSTTPWPAPTPWSPTAPAAVDVNTADAAVLGTLDEFDPARVAYVLSERHRRGGFTSLAEFAATAQLSQQQFDRIQHRLTLSPPQRW